MTSPPTFTERLTMRRRLWWDPPWPGRGRGLGDAIHRLAERRTYRGRDDPDGAWRCCERWPRTLLNKWNGREFAARHGCRLPELLWRGADHARAPLDELPNAFVIRPMFGAGRHGVAVVVDGRELLTGESASADELRDRMPRSHLRGDAPILIEEFAPSERGAFELPLEYKCHTFAGAVAIVQLIEREGPHGGSHRWYTPEWEPLSDQMNVGLPQSDVSAPPACLEEMLSLASTLGCQLATYMRIDFFSTDRGCLFGEFSSLPGGGLDHTPYCDELFGARWAAHCPDAT